ncbi:CLUMA_CG001035, isoform A [Clunio marinus]|uniref:CLUMA_CG001035, isoform A n=1 Tax=Clunio marinus TaxID=568069 RepID=A0A1J1HGU7_9DIPT|nr:CLUMA_CG001035, isoform A [Clunio marinus]
MESSRTLTNKNFLLDGMKSPKNILWKGKPVKLRLKKGDVDKLFRSKSVMGMNLHCHSLLKTLVSDDSEIW